MSVTSCDWCDLVRPSRAGFGRSLSPPARTFPVGSAENFFSSPELPVAPWNPDFFMKRAFRNPAIRTIGPFGPKLARFDEELCGIIMEINNLHKPLVGNQRLASAAAQGPAGRQKFPLFRGPPFLRNFIFRHNWRAAGPIGAAPIPPEANTSRRSRYVKERTP